MARKLNFRNGSSISRITAPLRLLAHRFIFLFLISAAIGTMLLARADSVAVEKASVIVTDLFSPLLDFFSRPAATINSAVQKFEDLVSLHSENERLKAENKRLKDWQMVARDLASQNRSLKSLMQFSADPKSRQITARVVGDSGGAFVRSAIINAGTRDGIEKGQAVITGDGLAGRIIAVGLQSSRILLVTDINSRVPVIVETSRDRAILAGNNSGQPKLAFLSVIAAVKEGDRVVTSGHGGVFPPGLPVGTILNAGDGTVRIAPFAQLNRLEFVRVLTYEKIVPPAAKRSRVLNKRNISLP